jgi:eukaryotic-like serine/threonine-protein kinase
MATVHLARLRGAVGFSKMVAIKRLHPQFAKDPEFVSMFLDEARLAARIRHPHVVPTLDVVATPGELFLVMEYIHGVSVQRLFKRARELGERMPVDVSCGIAVGALRGLHAAHEAKSEKGNSLDIVHRDVSPQNVMVGVDGLSRVLDFGVAKASWRIQTTRQGQVKGKVSYMAPEQVMGGGVGPWTDVHALGIVLWEMLTGERLFPVSEERGLLARFTQKVDVAPPSSLNPEVPPELDAAVIQALAYDADQRQPRAQVMADQIEAACSVGSSARIGRYVEYLAEEELSQRAQRIAEIEGSSVVSVVTAVMGPLLGKLDSATAVDATTPNATPTVVTKLDVPPPPSGDDASKISMTSTVEEQPVSVTPPRRRAAALIAAGGAVMLLALVLLAATLREERPGATPKTAAAAVSFAPIVTEPGSKPESVAPPKPEFEAAAPPEPQSSAIVDLAALPVERPATGAEPTVKLAAKRKAPTSARRASCNPPYTVDSRGVRHLKMECVR